MGLLTFEEPHTLLVPTTEFEKHGKPNPINKYRGLAVQPIMQYITNGTSGSSSAAEELPPPVTKHCGQKLLQHRCCSTRLAQHNAQGATSPSKRARLSRPVHDPYNTLRAPQRFFEGYGLPQRRAHSTHDSNDVYVCADSGQARLGITLTTRGGCG